MENESDVLQELWGEELYAEAVAGMLDGWDPSPILNEDRDVFRPLTDDTAQDQVLATLERVIRRDGSFRDRRAA